jgi:hypothetical protein
MTIVPCSYRSAALALTAQSKMLRPWKMKEKFDMVTTDFVYIRWLGDRQGIEKIRQVWDKAVVDRTEELSNWVVRKLAIQISIVYCLLNYRVANTGGGNRAS